MSYYRRPMGDYKTYGYAGDPGFLSSLWKGVKTVGKYLLGVPAAPVAAGGAGFAVGQQYPGAPQGSFPGTGVTPYQYGPTGTFGPTTPKGISIAGQIPGCPAPSGYHLAKDGSGRMVRNRRMNVTNPRALRRAMRRVQGFEKMAKRTITFTRRTRMKK